MLALLWLEEELLAVLAPMDIWSKSSTENVRKHPSFCSHSATGTIVSGPLPDGSYQMLFYGEATEVRSEELLIERKDDDTGRVVSSKIDSSRVREDRARICMPEGALRALYDLLKDRFDGESNGESGAK